LPLAADEFSSLHEAEPNDVRIATLLGQCYVRLGRDAEVISLLMPLEKANPGNLDLEWALGSALIRSGRTEEGAERVEKVAEQGHNGEAYMVAAQSYLKLAAFDKARRNFDAAMRLNPHLPGLYTLGGMIVEYSGDPQGAAGAYQKALEANPNDFEARLHLAAVLYERRQLDAARQHLDRALEIQPTSSSARYELARVERAQGQLEAALKDLEEVVRNEPDWLPPHIELVALYYRLKRPEDGAREKTIVDRLSADEQQRTSKSRVIAPTLPSH
jgi:tetratricopeptide (TPR) repeat protein